MIGQQEYCNKCKLPLREWELCGRGYCEICENDMSEMHGGKRDGAGRKASLDGKGRTVPKSIKVSREVANYLQEVGTGVIEDALRKSKAFRDWKKRERLKARHPG